MICPCGATIAPDYPYCSANCRHNDMFRMGGFCAGYIAGISAARKVVHRLGDDREMPAFRLSLDIAERFDDLIGLYELAWEGYRAKRSQVERTL